MTNLTLKKALVAAVAAVALLAAGCGARDQPALGASAEAPTSVFEPVPSTLAVTTTSVAPATVPATTAPAATPAPSAPAAPPAAVNTAPVVAQATLDDVLDEVDKALADIDDALADTEDNR